MSLELGKSGKRGGAGEEIFPKVYIDECQIVAVLDKSGQPIFDGQDPSDLALELELQVKGLDNTIKQTLNGNFKRENGEVVNWGGAFTIDYLLSQLGYYEGLTEDEKTAEVERFTQGSISTNVRSFLVGKKVYRVTYVKGVKADDPTKYAYTSWNKFHASKEKAIENFEWAMNNDKYIMEKYAPDADNTSGSSDGGGSEDDEEMPI